MGSDVHLLGLHTKKPVKTLPQRVREHGLIQNGSSWYQQWWRGICVPLLSGCVLSFLKLCSLYVLTLESRREKLKNLVMCRSEIWHCWAVFPTAISHSNFPNETTSKNQKPQFTNSFIKIYSQIFVKCQHGRCSSAQGKAPVLMLMTF